MPDELYEVRSALTLGNHHAAIAEGTQARCASKKHDDVQAFNAERDLLVAKAQVALGQTEQVISEHRAATHHNLVAARLWAQFHAALNANQSAAMDEAVTELRALMGEGAAPTSDKANVAILAITAMIHRKSYNDALPLAHKWATGLDATADARYVVEFHGILVDGLLRLNRVDAAEKQLTAMKAVDDDAILTQYIGAVVALRCHKPEKYQEVINTVNDLAGRCGMTVALHNLSALAQIGLGKAGDAERTLLDALAKKSGDHTTVANLSVASAQGGKPWEASQRFINQAKASSKMAPWTQTHEGMQQRFRDAALIVANDNDE